jgi:membrane protein implicated in regulation of membrane protease activity
VSQAFSWGAVVALALLALVLAVGWWRASRRVGRDNQRRAGVARAGENAAERLLARAGYRVVARQETRRFALTVDGEDLDATCRADLVVDAADGTTWVAEVKTGGATRPTAPQTRRQLLEYALVFDVDGVLLVDMEEGQVHVITFPFLD